MQPQASSFEIGMLWPVHITNYVGLFCVCCLFFLLSCAANWLRVWLLWMWASFPAAATELISHSPLKGHQQCLISTGSHGFMEQQTNLLSLLCFKYFLATLGFFAFQIHSPSAHTDFCPFLSFHTQTTLQCTLTNLRFSINRFIYSWNFLWNVTPNYSRKFTCLWIFCCANILKKMQLGKLQ